MIKIQGERNSRILVPALEGDRNPEEGERELGRYRDLEREREIQRGKKDPERGEDRDPEGAGIRHPE